jgi:hypothetical protein
MLRHRLTDMLFSQMTALESLWIKERTNQEKEGNSHFPVAMSWPLLNRFWILHQTLELLKFFSFGIVSALQCPLHTSMIRVRPLFGVFLPSSIHP